MNTDIGQSGESYCLQRRNVRLDAPRWQPAGVFRWTWVKLLGGEDLFFFGRVVAEARHVQDVLPPPLSAVESAETYAKKAAFGGKVGHVVGRRKGGRLRSIFSRELPIFPCMMAKPAPVWKSKYWLWEQRS